MILFPAFAEIHFYCSFLQGAHLELNKCQFPSGSFTFPQNCAQCLAGSRRRGGKATIIANRGLFKCPRHRSNTQSSQQFLRADLNVPIFRWGNWGTGRLSNLGSAKHISCKPRETLTLSRTQQRKPSRSLASSSAPEPPERAGPSRGSPAHRGGSPGPEFPLPP